MDNKQDRQFYWEVKDFMQRNPTPKPSNKPSLKDSIKSVLHENKPYKVSNFSFQSNIIQPSNQLIGVHSKIEKGNAPSCVAYTRNGSSNPFNLSEAVITPKTPSTSLGNMDDRVRFDTDNDKPSISLPTMKNKQTLSDTSKKPETTTQQSQQGAENKPQTAPTDLKSAMEQNAANNKQGAENKPQTAPTDLKSAMEQNAANNKQSTSDSPNPLGTPDLSIRPISGSVLPPFNSLARNFNNSRESDFRYASGTRIA
jgi:hypothetical protein